MIIDDHNHPDWYGYDLQKYLKNMDEVGIDKTVLLSWEAPADEYDPAYICKTPSMFTGQTCPISFERCISYAERCPDRFILGYAPDPRRPHGLDQFKAAVDLYNVKVCGEVKMRMMYDNWDAIEMWRYCGEHGLPVLMHFDYPFKTAKNVRDNWWYGGPIETLERVLQLCPETNFIGHAPGFWCHISDDEQAVTNQYPTGPVKGEGKLITYLRKYPNLYCDMSAGSGCSALKRDIEFTKKFLDEFQDRVCYGRDWFDNIHRELLESEELALPQAIKEKLYHKNIERLIGEC